MASAKWMNDLVAFPSWLQPVFLRFPHFPPSAPFFPFFLLPNDALGSALFVFSVEITFFGLLLIYPVLPDFLEF